MQEPWLPSIPSSTSVWGLNGCCYFWKYPGHVLMRRVGGVASGSGPACLASLLARFHAAHHRGETNTFSAGHLVFILIASCIPLVRSTRRCIARAPHQRHAIRPSGTDHLRPFALSLHIPVKHIQTSETLPGYAYATSRPSSRCGSTRLKYVTKSASISQKSYRYSCEKYQYMSTRFQ